ncbi:MAG: hypothetical protein LBQ60_07735 [Bacteroidales bacterium]|jgi:tetratricopeptide (TPR) repeat protein|nr:hypothetical protein [Bacteroidales bacterium]
MTKDELMFLVRNPDKTVSSVEDLRQLTDQYPYFHTVHLLYLQGLKKSNDDRFSGQLHQSSMNVRDRRILYYYLNGSADQATLLLSDNGTKDLAETSALPETKEQKDDHIPTPAEEVTMSNAELLAIIQQQMEEIGMVRTDKQKKQTKDTINVSGVGESNEKINLADKILKDLQEQKEKDTIAEVSCESSMDNESNDLIDQFLKKNPKIIPSDTDYKVNLSDSIEDTPDIATETLADIYVSQGHIQKAIKIYEQLILKYPEKHIYFAAQIDRLKTRT